LRLVRASAEQGGGVAGGEVFAQAFGEGAGVGWVRVQVDVGVPVFDGGDLDLGAVMGGSPWSRERSKYGRGGRHIAGVHLRPMISRGCARSAGPLRAQTDGRQAAGGRSLRRGASSVHGIANWARAVGGKIVRRPMAGGAFPLRGLMTSDPRAVARLAARGRRAATVGGGALVCRSGTSGRGAAWVMLPAGVDHARIRSALATGGRRWPRRDPDRWRNSDYKDDIRAGARIRRRRESATWMWGRPAGCGGWSGALPDDRGDKAAFAFLDPILRGVGAGQGIFRRRGIVTGGRPTCEQGYLRRGARRGPGIS
jgi:hypothetical protein